MMRSANRLETLFTFQKNNSVYRASFQLAALVGVKRDLTASPLRHDFAAFVKKNRDLDLASLHVRTKDDGNAELKASASARLSQDRKGFGKRP